MKICATESMWRTIDIFLKMTLGYNYKAILKVKSIYPVLINYAVFSLYIVGYYHLKY